MHACFACMIVSDSHVFPVPEETRRETEYFWPPWAPHSDAHTQPTPYTYTQLKVIKADIKRDMYIQRDGLMDKFQAVLYGCWEPSLGPLQGQPALFIPGPSLQPLLKEFCIIELKYSSEIPWLMGKLYTSGF